MKSEFDISKVPERDRTPVVNSLLDLTASLTEQLYLANEQNQLLKDEISILKGEKPRPKIPKSKLEGDRPGSSGKKSDKKTGKRPGSAKRSKTAELDIHETQVLRPEGIEEGWIFKGYKDFVVQGLIIEPHNTLYRRQRWLTPEGKTVIADLPPEITKHFSPLLLSFIQHQYHNNRVTQPLITEQLLEFGVDISVGEVNNVLINHKDDFHAEKEEILQAGLSVSGYIQTDDTGTRHNGKNGYCNCISNDLFAYYASTNSKSRINFLELLRAGCNTYVLNDDAFSYMKQQGLAKYAIEIILSAPEKTFSDKTEWLSFLEEIGINRPNHIRLATEGALLASALSHCLSKNLVIQSDDAGQFNILIHALCWIHAERTINKLIGFTDKQREVLLETRGEIWDLYQLLKDYKEKPEAKLKTKIGKKFDKIFTKSTCFMTLNLALKRLHSNKAELLQVLDHPHIPLHTNSCETDVRERVTKDKVSGGTRSIAGKQARDTFLSLKKTCRKLGISFWEYLKDRNAAVRNIPNLAKLIRAKSETMPAHS